MGVNTPARTVLLTGGSSKFDGTRQRLMLPTEYTQMAGRAGRRGKDAFGACVLLAHEWCSAASGEAMLSRRHAPLQPSHRLSVSTGSW